MKIRSMATGIVAALTLGGATIGASQVAMASPEDGVAAWKAFIAEHGEGNGRSKFVDALGSAEALAVAKRWSALRGYDAPGMLAGASLPPELKPGTVINAGNVDAEWLKPYILPSLAERFKDSAWFGWKQAVIVPTASYYMPKGTLEQSEAAKGTAFNATPDGNLLTPDGQFALATQGAMPFLNPKNGLEATWSFVAHGIANDNLNFHPITMDVCNSSGSLERQYKAELWWQKMHGRKDVEPFGDINGMDGVVEGGAVYFTDPRDVRGLSGVRKRYADASKEDDFKVFVPTLKRTRILSATDGQDPLAAGLELIWDDWRAYWVKTDPSKFDYELVGESWTLGFPHTGHFYQAAQRDGSCAVDTVELELRPVWILEIKDKTGKYIYSKRRIYLDKEFYYPVANEFYDARGNLMRVWYDSRDWVPNTGQAQWRQVALWNVISNRITWLEMESRWENLDTNPTPSLFDIDQLRDYK
ncbi:outer membrane lipoprotein-sorting protein [Zavarzinia compransoris]|uniref:outer membrane lipoprotein-sorting protein n=1 Tax=Zavarzinia marina TaxID=2911065 RepID=UPI001F33CD08|nr:outer membrane lipoprotein-sorting protein [Zavarzinia marina]MCF4165750.1 outer membrane lipoprotein-sorting protein [Zavarzinia marina]